MGWLRFWQRARVRLTAAYGALFLASGAALVAVTYGLFERATVFRAPRLPAVPATPAMPDLQPQILALTAVQRKLQLLAAVRGGQQPAAGGVPGSQQLSLDRQLMADQRQLTSSLHQLSGSVHQLAQAGPAQAAQRASDAHQLLVNSGLALAVMAVLALLAGWLVAGRMLRPIRTITGAARRISSASLHERLALTGPHDELKELGDTLDGLFARLEAAFEAQRNFVASASHELRTPLTAERALLQVALDDPAMTAAQWRATAAEVLASSDEQAALIEALLTLASSEAGLSAREPADLAAAVAAARDGLAADLERRGIDLAADTGPAPLLGDPLLVGRLAANLLSNAVRHNVPGGRVRVRTGVHDGRAVLTVTNTGPVIPAAEVDRLCRPFQRLDRRRGHYQDGHGLGLSIVAAIAAAHGGTVDLAPQPGGGLSARVSFPAAAVVAA